MLKLLIQALDVGDVEAALGACLQVLVGADRRVQFLQDAAVVHQHAVALGVVQAVHPRHRLDQVVALQRLVDVEHGVARLVEAGEQLVDHDQQVRPAVACRSRRPPASRRSSASAPFQHVLLPPLLHLGQRVFVDLGVAFARVGRRDHDGAGHQAGVVQRLLVADGVELAVGGDWPFRPRSKLLDVLAEVRGDIPGDQLDAVGGAVDRALLGELLLQVGALRVATGPR